MMDDNVCYECYRKKLYKTCLVRKECDELEGYEQYENKGVES